MFNKTIAGRRRTLLLNVKPARISVKTNNPFSSGKLLLNHDVSTGNAKHRSWTTGTQNIKIHPPEETKRNFHRQFQSFLLVNIRFINRNAIEIICEDKLQLPTGCLCFDLCGPRQCSQQCRHWSRHMEKSKLYTISLGG